MAGPPLSPSQWEEIQQTTLIVLIKGTSPEGRKQFAYFAFPATSIPAIQQAMQQASIDFNEFGTLLLGGEGEPDATVMQRLETEFSLRHEDAVILEMSAPHTT